MSIRGVTEPAFFVLAALVAGPRHGYGIVQEVDSLSHGRVQLKIGTLYGVLDRLVADGLVEPDREGVWQGRLRRYYRLTSAGEPGLTGEAERQGPHPAAPQHTAAPPRPPRAAGAGR